MMHEWTNLAEAAPARAATTNPRGSIGRRPKLAAATGLQPARPHFAKPGTRGGRRPRHDHRFVHLDGRRLCLSDAARELGISVGALNWRIINRTGTYHYGEVDVRQIGADVPRRPTDPNHVVPNQSQYQKKWRRRRATALNQLLKFAQTCHAFFDYMRRRRSKLAPPESWIAQLQDAIVEATPLYRKRRKWTSEGSRRASIRGSR